MILAGTRSPTLSNIIWQIKILSALTPTNSLFRKLLLLVFGIFCKASSRCRRLGPRKLGSGLKEGLWLTMIRLGLDGMEEIGRLRLLETKFSDPLKLLEKILGNQ